MVAMDIQPVHLTKNIVYAASFDLTKMVNICQINKRLKQMVIGLIGL